MALDDLMYISTGPQMGVAWVAPNPVAQASSRPNISCVSGASVNLNRRLSRKIAAENRLSPMGRNFLIIDMTDPLMMSVLVV